MLYLDYNATTPVAPQVAQAVARGLGELWGNPSSAHLLGARAKLALEEARAQVAALLGASPEEIVFTSGGTEANNMAILGLAALRRTGHIISSQIEHPSVLRPLQLLQGQGFQITLLPPNSRGVVEPEAVRRALRPQTFLITIMHANNETGMLQPIQEIATLAREAGVLLHTDCAQSVGKHPVDVQALGADMLTVAGHKLYGPKGIGALYVRQGVELRPVLFGASQERGLRPGTENLPGALGLAAAARLAVQELPSERQRLGELSELLWRELKERLPQARLNAWGSAEEKLPNTLNVCIPGVDATELVEALARRVAISAGAACHAGRKSPSHVLTAMGISPQDALCSVRLSLGRHTRAEELKEAAAALAAAARQLAQAPPGRGGAP